MKYVTLAFTALALAASAALAKETPAADKGASDFMVEYMHCDTIEIKKHKKEKLTCVEEVNLKYCRSLERLPNDAQSNIELQLQCDFLGQQLGDDKETNEQLIEMARSLGCQQSELGTLTLLRKYWNKKNEARALLFFGDEYQAEEDVCIKKEGKAAEPEKKIEKKAEKKEEKSEEKTDTKEEKVEEKKPETTTP